MGSYSYSDIETLMQDASDATVAGDYSLAETKATSALALFALIPFKARKEGHASGEWEYSETLIGEFIDRVKNLAGRQAQNAHPFGIQVLPYRLGNERCGETVGEF